MSSASDPEAEASLQRRLMILKSFIESGRITAQPNSGVMECYKAIKYRADGTADPETIDPRVRAMALAAEYMHDQDDLKARISLSDIQRGYFEFLDRHFGSFYKLMVEKGLSPHDVGKALSQRPAQIKELNRDLEAFLEQTRRFWSEVGSVAHAHVEDLHALKGVFGGDLFPAANENIASKCGIYTDTIILPDPFLRSKPIFESESQQQRAYYLVKHGLNLLKYKELACAPIVPPIVVILPDRAMLDDGEKRFNFKLGTADALIHASRIFGRSFESSDELIAYCATLDTVDRVASAAVDASRVLFDLDWGDDIRKQLGQALEDKTADMIRTRHPGLLLATQTVGRMSIANELLNRAGRLRGTPIIDAPTSWKYFNWKLEYDATRLLPELALEDVHVLRGIQSLSEHHMQWLGKIPPEALLEMRRVGALEEIRSILGGGIEELVTVSPLDFRKTSAKVLGNLALAFVDHSRRVDELTAKKWKFAGIDLPSCVAVGALAVAAAATGMPTLGVALVAADQLLPTPKLKDIPKSIRDLAEASRQVYHSPAGLLFQYKQPRSA